MTDTKDQAYAQLNCIDNSGWEDCLTQGKTYELIKQVRMISGEILFKVKDNRGEEKLFKPHRFETLIN